jgi:hypothetical protein
MNVSQEQQEHLHERAGKPKRSIEFNSSGASLLK